MCCSPFRTAKALLQGARIIYDKQNCLWLQNQKMVGQFIGMTFPFEPHDDAPLFWIPVPLQRYKNIPMPIFDRSEKLRNHQVTRDES